MPIQSRYSCHLCCPRFLAVALFIFSVLLSLPRIAAAQLMPNAPWPTANGNLTNTGGYPGPGSNGSLRWTLTASAELLGGAIVSANNTVYIADSNGLLHAIDGALGSAKWTYAASGYVRSTPAIGKNNYVYLGDSGGTLQAVNGATGALIWTYNSPNGKYIYGSPTIGPNGTVYFGCNDGYIYALNGTTGALVWSYQTSGNFLFGTAAIDSNGILYYGTYDKYLYALDSATGTLKWKFLANDVIESSPVIGPDGTIYFNTLNGGLYALNSSGGQVWATSISSEVSGSIAIDSNQLYVGDVAGYMLALSLKTGNEVWFANTGSGIYTTPIVEADGNIVVGNGAGMIEEFEPTAGQQLWSYTTPSQAGSTPLAIAADGAIFFGDPNSVIYALDGARVSKVYASPSEVVGGAITYGVVQLTQEAGAKGETVTIPNAYSDISLPYSVFIPAGKTGVSFQIQTSSVSAQETLVLHAYTASGAISTFQVVVDPAAISNFYTSPSSVVGGKSTVGVVQLTGKAGSSGDVVNISGGNGVASGPTMVTVPSGGTGVSFSISTSPVSASTQATFTATFGTSTKNASVTVNPAPLSNFYTTPTSTTGGISVSGVVQLSGKAGPSGNTVSLQSSSGTAVVPASVTVPAGSTGKSFTITTSPVSVSTNVTLTAVSVATLHITLTLNPYPISNFYVTPNSVVGGVTTHGVVQLAGKAGPSGDVVSLQSNSAKATVPSTVTVPAGSTGVSFAIVTYAVTANTTVTLTAKLGTSTKTYAVTLTP